jgi:uncharacterized SAM-binding protein YcdF (DUF218 family)
MKLDSVDSHAIVLWDYFCLNQKLEKVDCLIAFGGSDLLVGMYSAKLMVDEWSSIMICTGNSGKNTIHYQKTEADIFSDIAINIGVSKDKILLETKATNTSENIAFSLDLIQSLQLKADKILLVTKTYTERRVAATFSKLFPQIKYVVSSFPISYYQYSTGVCSKEKLINKLVGCLQRIKDYPDMGYQNYQHIPETVLNSYYYLIRLGYGDDVII